MKLIQKQEYQKKPASKAKLKESSRRTRFQVINATREENSELFDRRSSRFKIKKQRKQSSPYLSDRKLIIFLTPFCIPPVQKQEATKVIFNNNINNITPTEQLAYARRNAKAFENESLALRRVFSPKYPKGYIETPPKNHQEKKNHKGEELRSIVLEQRIRPEPRPSGVGGDQAINNAINATEWKDLVDSVGIIFALEFLESGLISATHLVLWDFEEGAES